MVEDEIVTALGERTCVVVGIREDHINTEFQGLWPLHTKEEMKEVCSAFNISKEHCTKYVQFGNTSSLLHAAASFISDHQNSFGVAGVG